MKFKYSFNNKNGDYCFALNLGDIAKFLKTSLSNVKYHRCYSSKKTQFETVDYDIEDLFDKYGNQYYLTQSGILIFKKKQKFKKAEDFITYDNDYYDDD